MPRHNLGGRGLSRYKQSEHEQAFKFLLLPEKMRMLYFVE
jgi:hypothetical protein